MKDLLYASIAPSPPATLEAKRRTSANRAVGKRKERAGRAPKGNGVAARFGVFSDGSVQVDAPGCKGVLTGKDVDLLVAFVGKLRAK